MERGEGLLVGDYFSEGVVDSLSDSGGWGAGGLSDKIPVIR